MKKPMRRALYITVIGALAVGAGLWWRYSGPVKADAAGDATAKVVRRDIVSTVLATGAVKPRVGAEVRVGARISGKVERLYANIGDVVKKGQVIAELEKADLEAMLAQWQADLRMAEAKSHAVENLRPKEIEKAEADVTKCEASAVLARKELERQQCLVNKGVGTRQVLEQAQEQLSVTDAQFASARKALELAKVGYTEDARQARANLDRAGAAVRNAEVQLSYATITAPIDGVIGSVSTQEGETVAAGLNAPTFVTIIDLSRLQVDAYVDEVDIGKVKPGQKATFTVDSFPSREFSGKVIAIYPKAVIQENVVNYDVVVEIADKYDGLLRPEMTASVTVQLDARENVLAVPAKAVKREKGKNVAYLVSNGQTQPREVKVGWKDSQWIEIMSGLDEGQTVLLEPPMPAKPTER
jgi:multidrug efflux pump subunit AcrA (membrane-fusion protein)